MSNTDTVQKNALLRAAFATGGAYAALGASNRFFAYHLEPDPDNPAKPKKVPYHYTGRYKISVTEPSNHTDWKTALDSIDTLGDGWLLGRAFLADEKFFFHDIDACMQNGQYVGPVTQILPEFNRLGAAVEVSISGVGLHIFGKYAGDEPDHQCKTAPGLELYTDGRGCCFGTPMSGNASVDCTHYLNWLIDNYFPPAKVGEDAQWTDAGIDPALDDALIKKAHHSKHSSEAAFNNKASFTDLFNGDQLKLQAAFPGPSEMDYNLAWRLCFWTARDCAQIERIMLKSALKRDKWQDKRKDTNYLRYTILRAVSDHIAVGADVYTGKRSDAGVPPPGPSPITHRKAIANHLCTDMANAKRIQDHFEGQIIAVGKRWMFWNGKCWTDDGGAVWDLAQRLSTVVRAEAVVWDTRSKQEQQPGPDGAPIGDNGHQSSVNAKALGAWAIKCESKQTIENALGVLAKLCDVKESNFDQDVHLLNCNNGIVNLKTGELLPHDPLRLMSHLCPVDYVPTALCTNTRGAMLEIMGGDEEKVAYLWRLFGYSCTGETTEHLFPMHVGYGRNGKSLLIKLLQRILGDYMVSIDAGILASKDLANNNPEKTVQLVGKRFAVASEPEKGAPLKESFVKLLSGGDRVSARHLYNASFQVDLQCKVHLLMNAKPRISGTDDGIWDRLHVINYPVHFGDQEMVATGQAHRLKNEQLFEQLLLEREGILAALVQGAIQWYQMGTKPPASVRNATGKYREESDKVALFVKEHCEIGKLKEEALDGTGQSLYWCYKQWCNDSEVPPVSKFRFLERLEHIVQALFDTYRKKVLTPAGGRKDVTFVRGLQLRDPNHFNVFNGSDPFVPPPIPPI